MTRSTQPSLVADLSALLSRERVSIATPDRVKHASDAWPKAQMWRQAGGVEPHRPDCVVWPETHEEVQALLTYCRDKGIPLVPYGGGTGVCGGVVPIQGGISVDLRRLSKVVSLDIRSQCVQVESGITGGELERQLHEAGFTLGHAPASMERSTLGGWLATRSAGEYSSRYGKIEDMVMSLRAVLPDGTLVDTSQRAPGEPDWTQLLVGSEGTLAVITDATLRIHPLPEHRLTQSYKFDHLHQALDAMRLVMQSGLKPVIMKVYDPFDTFMVLSGRSEGGARAALEQGRGRGSGLWKRLKEQGATYALSVPGIVNRATQIIGNSCLIVIGFEGPRLAVERHFARANEIILDGGGREPTQPPSETSLGKHYEVSYGYNGVHQEGSFADTMEAATTWDRLHSLHDEVMRAVFPHAVVVSHFTHAYREGCSVYFTFAAHRRQLERSSDLYDEVWNKALAAAHRIGATASHHHGVGLAKRSGMVEEHGEMLRVWWGLKKSIDGDSLMNPGKLFPEQAGSP